ncbi:cytochrome P450 [Dacryopinax primogenitus]|uniref:Cytochrome P450 n=1 Tax=Dacryopinax primogenitus (strain DJM 731) TaxID=1858805 RepID=M5GCJ7_DACPD|nr:cytochrome P450 [Dacryopinax primogenitus]EJU01813.1 cytochrome P450 [Dacryopinax primogenitus]
MFSYFDLSRIPTLGLIVLAVIAAGYTLRGLWQFSRRFFTPIRHLPGPSRRSWLWGNAAAVLQDDACLCEWTEQFGVAYRLPSMLGKCRLNTIDPRAVGHILSHTDIYPKAEHARTLLRAAIGEGLVVAEGDTHKRQRKIMNPSFAPIQIREATPIFFEISYQLRDVLNELQGMAVSTQGVELDMFAWIGRASLEIIGLAGFGYRFNCLVDESNELFHAYHDMEQELGRNPLTDLLKDRFKFLRRIPGFRNPVMDAALNTTHRVGTELVMKRKAEVFEEMQSKFGQNGKIAGRDVLTALIRANMAAGVSENQQMSDREVLAQISTFIIAGHETSASAVTWTLMSLAQYPEVQGKLREELSLVSQDMPTMDDLNALPYLDIVVKESLRLHSPVHYSLRVAKQDDTIPLLHPIVDRYGRKLDHLRVQAGDFVGVEIMPMNRSTALWGPDAGDFRPDRWNEETTGAKEISGVYAHTLTFIGGPRACIGYRFAITEMKAILFALIREFEFVPVPGKEIAVKNVIVARPYVKGEGTRLQLPLLVKRVSRAA